MVRWAAKQVLLWGVLASLVIFLLEARPELLRGKAPLGAPNRSVAAGAEEEGARLVFPGDPSGHVVVDAVVDGVAMKMLVDTGSTLVALSPRDATAAGIDLSALEFGGRVATAAGPVRAAPVSLREIRLGQLSVYDVRAEVLERLDISLLGMSFLSRLQGYEMRGGKLVLTW